MSRKRNTAKSENRMTESEAPQNKVVKYMPSLMSAIVGGIITGLFTLGGLFYANSRSDTQKLQHAITLKQEIRDELSYNRSLTKESVRGLRGVYEGWKQNRAYYNRNQPFKTIAYEQRDIPLSFLYSTNDLNFLVNIYETIRYVNREFEKYNDQYRNDARDFGDKIATIKMIEKTEILINHVLSIQFQIAWFTDGNSKWDSTYYDNLARFQNAYWSIPFDSTLRIELGNSRNKDGFSIPLGVVPIHADSVKIFIP